MKVRRNIYELLAEDANHPMIANYRRAVEIMRGRPDSDPTSWIYQANIHGRPFGDTSSQPAGAPFNTCQHGTPYFLAWHRMYLYYFERIVRRACGNPDFALPYWDWSADRRLPPPFRSATVSGGANALYEPSRSATINGGGQLPTSSIASADDIAQMNYFSFQTGLEGTPHGAIHVSIGGIMSSVPTAARDPIFWLHHCNIDRLWEVWLYTHPDHHNPEADATWMNHIFTFADENGTLVSMKGADILDTQAQLKYVYEHTCRPVISFFPRPILVADARAKQFLASHVIAKDVKLPAGAERIRLVHRDDPAKAALVKALGPDEFAKLRAQGSRVLLIFQDVASKAALDGYFEVYLALPEGAKASSESLAYAGNLVTFGADEASRRAAGKAHVGHGGDGIRVELDITDALSRLPDRDQALAAGLSLTLVPVGAEAQGDKPFRFGADKDVAIGSITLSIVTLPKPLR